MKAKASLALTGIFGLMVLGVSVLAGQEPSPAPKAHAEVLVGSDEGPQNVFVTRVGRGHLGVSVANVDDDKMKELGLTDRRGALITHVSEDSAADKAGMKEDDVVIEFDGERVRSAAQLTRLVQETPPNSEVSLTVRRGGKEKRLTATLKPRGGSFAFRTAPNWTARVAPVVPGMPNMPRIRVAPRIAGNSFFFRSQPRLGISGDGIDGQLAEYFGVAGGHGVLIRSVSEGSAAEKAGLKAGDVIIQVGDDELDSVGDLRRALSKADKDDPTVTLTIVREGKQQAISVTLDIPDEDDRVRWSGLVCEDDDCDFDFDFKFDFDSERFGEELRESLKGLRERMRDTEIQLRDRERETRKLIKLKLNLAGARII